MKFTKKLSLSIISFSLAFVLAFGVMACIFIVKPTNTTATDINHTEQLAFGNLNKPGKISLTQYTPTNSENGNVATPGEGESVTIVARHVDEGLVLGFIWELSWVDSSGWAEGKSVEDYLSLDVGSNLTVENGYQTADIRCLQPFGTQVVLTVKVQNTNVSETCTIDYKQRVVSCMFVIGAPIDSNAGISGFQGSSSDASLESSVNVQNTVPLYYFSSLGTDFEQGYILGFDQEDTDDGEPGFGIRFSYSDVYSLSIEDKVGDRGIKAKPTQTYLDAFVSAGLTPKENAINGVSATFGGMTYANFMFDCFVETPFENVTQFNAFLTALQGKAGQTLVTYEVWEGYNDGTSNRYTFNLSFSEQDLIVINYTQDIDLTYSGIVF